MNFAIGAWLPRDCVDFRKASFGIVRFVQLLDCASQGGRKDRLRYENNGLANRHCTRGRIRCTLATAQNPKQNLSCKSTEDTA